MDIKKNHPMLSQQAIEAIVRRIVSAAHAPSKVIIFGSYARGNARQDSDLDVLVVEREILDLGEEILRLNAAAGRLPVDIDILVYAEEEFEKRKDWCSTPVYWATREGKVLYEYHQ
jgi:predicted nucleotidyltransferase